MAAGGTARRGRCEPSAKRMRRRTPSPSSAAIGASRMRTPFAARTEASSRFWPSLHPPARSTRECDEPRRAASASQRCQGRRLPCTGQHRTIIDASSAPGRPPCRPRQWPRSVGQRIRIHSLGARPPGRTISRHVGVLLQCVDIGDAQALAVGSNEPVGLELAQYPSKISDCHIEMASDSAG